MGGGGVFSELEVAASVVANLEQLLVEMADTGRVRIREPVLRAKQRIVECCMATFMDSGSNILLRVSEWVE